MNAERLVAMVKKEFVQMRRDPATLRLMLAVPVIQLLVFGFAVRTDVRNLPTVVFDQSRTQESRAFVQALVATDNFAVKREVRSYAEAIEAVDAGQARAAVVMPPDYARNLKRGDTAPVQVLVDASDPTASQSAIAAAQLVGQRTNMTLVAARTSAGGNPLTNLPVDVRVRPLYNPALANAIFIVPGLIGMILSNTLIIITALTVVRERETGTLEQLIVTPLAKWEIMLGKIAPYVLVGYVQLTTVLVVGHWVFHVPIRGPLPALYGASLLFIIASLGLGLFISTLGRNQAQVMQIAFLFLLPNILLSGFMWPREAMPAAARWVGMILPLTHYLRLVRRDEVQPLPPAVARTAPDPYRVLFPLGVAAALAGLVPWILVAVRVPLAWPGPVHAALMVQGFELAFVSGFLLTAMPAFTHGPRCTPVELGVVTALVAAHVVLRALDVPAAAWAFLAALVALGFVVARRVRAGEAAPPEEFLLAGAGIAMGLAGAVVQVLVSLSLMPEAAERAGVRCVSLGMLPALVLGLGGLLVPTFARMSDPLSIAGVARAGERVRRRVFVVAVAALLVVAVNLDFAGRVGAAGWCRALAALASTQLAWKLWRLPGRRDRLSWSIWTAGWCVALGFTAAAVWPLHRVEAWHVAFAGGYALLTLGIGTRVVVSHGGHAMSEEDVVLSALAVQALVAAALVRSLGPVLDPTHATQHHAVAAALAIVALGGWLLAAWPRLRRTRPRLIRLEREEKS